MAVIDSCTWPFFFFLCLFLTRSKRNDPSFTSKDARSQPQPAFLFLLPHPWKWESLFANTSALHSPAVKLLVCFPPWFLLEKEVLIGAVMSMGIFFLHKPKVVGLWFSLKKKIKKKIESLDCWNFDCNKCSWESCWTRLKNNNIKRESLAVKTRAGGAGLRASDRWRT